VWSQHETAQAAAVESIGDDEPSSAGSGGDDLTLAPDEVPGRDGTSGGDGLAPPSASRAESRTAIATRGTLAADLHKIVVKGLADARAVSKGRVDASNTTIAVDVRELGLGAAGEIAIDADRPMRPASNLKLVTTAAALVLLGPDFQFDTRFDAVGEIDEGVLEGDLVVRAAADPLYVRDGNGDIEALLAPALEQIYAQGVRVVKGDVVLDESTFAEPSRAPEWPSKDQWWTEYCALAGGFSANRGCVTVTVEPERIGEPASVRAFPRDHGMLENFGVRTLASGGVVVHMQALASGLLVSGTIGAKSGRWSDACAAPDPVALFGSALRAALARRGVLVQGRVRRERGAPAGIAIAHLRSPLADQLTAINTDSTNACADQVFLATAYATSGYGTREAGARATKLALDRLGVPSAGLVQVDGSGLSRADRVSARQMAALIEAVLARDERSAQLYNDSLAVAGRTGTLEKRMRGTPAEGRVHAKTGFIGGTSSLSGIAPAPDGRVFVFSILVNFPEVDGLNSTWKTMQDALCLRILKEGA
jgi:D-alanyl-D-alanine carboxypeptidase/D-alanyl-D-alanine-endopeptidase (penicillin-binding protein 4)